MIVQGDEKKMLRKVDYKERRKKRKKRREKYKFKKERKCEFCEMWVKFYTFGWKEVMGFQMGLLGCGRKRDGKDDGFR